MSGPAPLALLACALLAAGRPLTPAELAGLLACRAAQVPGRIDQLNTVLAGAGLGFQAESVAGGFRLFVPPAVAAALSPLLAPPALPPLSPAALEVLAVIAYRQPVTRAEIEAMRGGSAGTVLTLQERELVKVLGRSEAIGQPLLYGTTERFLLEFGLASLNDLPELDASGFGQLLRG